MVRLHIKGACKRHQIYFCRKRSCKGRRDPHFPINLWRLFSGVGRTVGGKGVSGAREDLIQDSCVKGFGRNAFIRDIALPLSSLLTAHVFAPLSPKLRGFGGGGGSLYCGRSRSSHPLRSPMKRPTHEPCWPFRPLHRKYSMLSRYHFYTTLILNSSQVSWIGSTRIG